MKDDFAYNHLTNRFENEAGESLTLDEFRSRKNAEFGAWFDAKAVTRPARRLERESHINGIGFTKSGKRPGRA